MPRADFAFSHRIRVRWSEVDPQRVVFNARYLDYADIAVTEYYRAMRAGAHWRGEPEFHVRRAEVDFVRPVRADEEIDLLMRTVASGRTSTTYLVEMHGAGSEDLRAEVRSVAVHVDLATGRPTPLPDWWAAATVAIDRR